MILKIFTYLRVLFDKINERYILNDNIIDSWLCFFLNVKWYDLTEYCVTYSIGNKKFPFFFVSYFYKYSLVLKQRSKKSSQKIPKIV